MAAGQEECGFFRGVRASLLAPPLGLVMVVVMVVVVVTINE